MHELSDQIWVGIRKIAAYIFRSISFCPPAKMSELELHIIGLQCNNPVQFFQCVTMV